MKNFIRVMKALADPNRTIILQLLQKQWLCVCESPDVIILKQQPAYTLLKILENAGLVSSQKKAQRVCYKITNGEDSPYAAAMLGNLRHWLKEAEKTGQA